MTDIMDMNQIIAYHLEYNLPTPIHQSQIPFMTKICVEAINIVNRYTPAMRKEMMQQNIELGEDCVFDSYQRDGTQVNYIPAYEVIRLWDLEQWLKPCWH